MTSLFMSGSIIRCIDSCTLTEVIDNQRLMPFTQWSAFIQPGEVSLVLDVMPNEALLLIGNKVFALDLCQYDFTDYFEVLNVV